MIEEAHPDEEIIFRQSLVKYTKPHEKHENVLRVDLDGLRNESPQIASRLLTRPNQAIAQLKQAFKDTFDLRVQFQGQLGQNFVSPRGLGASLAEQLVGVQGIVTRMSSKKSILKQAVLLNPKNKQLIKRVLFDKFRPEEEFDPKHSNLNLVMKDKDGDDLQLQYGLSKFRDLQSIVVQELPEFAPSGLVPSSVEVYLQDSLVGTAKPGDRVQILGIYRLNVSSRTLTQGIFGGFLLATSIRTFSSFSLQKPLQLPKELVGAKIYQLLCNSIAPSVYGHSEVKKGILLCLAGGNERNLEGTRLRGNVNLLMVGDPGTAKSQMLRYVLQTAEIAVCTSGSGASGVGLTASVSRDKDTGERQLEAGAMVLADKGVVCIDQFDKMNETDRVAIHEVMEQQTVTIAKAGICCSLNARCSVVAAANPIYGQYRVDWPPTRNIGLPDSLLSRFDLIFIVQDLREEAIDLMIADRVCKNHQFCPRSEHEGSTAEGYVIKPLDEKQSSKQGVYQKELVFTQGRGEILTQQFVRDYIRQVRHMTPTVSEEATAFIQQAWLKLRKLELKNQMTYKVLPITIRSLESLIRLATAHAKLRLSQVVEHSDAFEAVSLFAYSLFGSDFDRHFSMQSDLPTPPSHPRKSKKSAADQKKEQELSRGIRNINVSGEVSEKEVLSVVTRRSQAALEARRKEVQAAIFNQMKQSVKGRKTNRFVAKEELLGLLPQFPREEMEEAITVLVEGGKLFIDGDNIRLI